MRVTGLLIVMALVGTPVGALACEILCRQAGATDHHNATGHHGMAAHDGMSAHDGMAAHDERQTSAVGSCHAEAAISAFVMKVRQGPRHRYPCGLSKRSRPLPRYVSLRARHHRLVEGLQHPASLARPRRSPSSVSDTSASVALSLRATPIRSPRTPGRFSASGSAAWRCPLDRWIPPGAWPEPIRGVVETL